MHAMLVSGGYADIPAAVAMTEAIYGVHRHIPDLTPAPASRIVDNMATCANPQATAKQGNACRSSQPGGVRKCRSQ
jgi:hypothetical protein